MRSTIHKPSQSPCLLSISQPGRGKQLTNDFIVSQCSVARDGPDSQSSSGTDSSSRGRRMDPYRPISTARCTRDPIRRQRRRRRQQRPAPVLVDGRRTRASKFGTGGSRSCGCDSELAASGGARMGGGGARWRGEAISRSQPRPSRFEAPGGDGRGAGRSSSPPLAAPVCPAGPCGAELGHVSLHSYGAARRAVRAGLLRHASPPDPRRAERIAARRQTN